MNNHSHKGVIAWFVQNPVAANLFMFSVIVMGLISFTDIRKEAFPSMEPDNIRVSVTYDSGDPEQAEEGIAIKIEEALETVSGIKRITSTSNASGSSVVIEKDSDYDLDVLFQDVKTNVDGIFNFPQQAEKPVITKARRQDHAIWVQLYGDVDRATLQPLAERLKADLLSQSGISDLEIIGKADPMMSIEIDEARLLAYGLTITDVSNAINNESSTAISSSLRNSERVIRLKGSEQAYTKTDFENIPIVSSQSGVIVRLGEIATISDTFADDTYVFSRYNGKNGLGIQIVMDEYSDITTIVEQANSVVEKWQKQGLLPNNVELVTWYDKSTLIVERLGLLLKNALSGIVIVFFILAIFLNLRVAFWVAAGLPFVFCGTLFLMTDTFTGLTINEMTTFGFIMALGIVVDDAVVIGESVYDTRQKYGDNIDSTIKGVHAVATPTLFGVATTAVAFIALTQVEGTLGQIYAQFATVVTLCLILSIVESKFILPSHLAHVKTDKKAASSFKHGFAYIQQKADMGLQWVNHRLYTPLLRAVLRFRYAAVMGFVAIFVLIAGLPLSGAVKVSFFPDIAGDIAQAEMTMQEDAAFGQTHQNLLDLESAVVDADAYLVEQHNADSSGILSIQVSASDDLSGKVLVELAPNAPYDVNALKQEWQKRIGSLEGTKKLKLVSSMAMGDNFKVEIKGWDDEALLQAGNQFKQALQSINGVSGIDDNLSAGEPLYRFELNEQGIALGMDTSTLSEQLLQNFGGDIVQRYQRNKDELKVRVRYPEEARQSHADIVEANIRTPNGTVVPLTSVANVIPDYQVNEVTRIDGQRAYYLSAAVDKEVIASNELVNLLQTGIVQRIQENNPTIEFHFAGEAEKQSETTSSMAKMFIMALLAIYLLLAIPLKSYTLPLIIMSVIPFGVIGAILGHWMNGLAISILSLNGILALSGVVINDSLLLVSRFNTLKASGTKFLDAVVQSCGSRLRAVLLTSITTFAGLAPLLSETSVQAQFLIPAAAALGYGILFATAITLILIPCLLVIRNDIQRVILLLKTRFQTPQWVHNE